MTVSGNIGIDNDERNFSFDGGTSVFQDNVSCRSGSGTNDRIIGEADASNQFWSGTNGSRCSSYAGALDWSFASDGHLVVTLGGSGDAVAHSVPAARRPGRSHGPGRGVEPPGRTSPQR